MPNFNPGGREKSSSDTNSRSNYGGRGSSPGSNPNSGYGNFNRDPSTYRGNSKGYREQRIRDHHRQYVQMTERERREYREEKRRREEAARRAEAERQAAISSRNAAFKSKSDAINKAFTDKYTDDYYSGLRASFNDEYMDDLQAAYDASMRGIWQGIRNAGVFDQAGFDTSKGKLDTARISEIADLDQLAMAYRDAQKKAVNDSRTGILAGLAGLSGGDNVSKSQADAQRAAINDYSYAAEMAKLRDDPDMGEGPSEFFSGFNQAAARQAARTPTVRAGSSPQQEQQARGLARTMVRSPVGGGSSTVIRG